MPRIILSGENNFIDVSAQKAQQIKEQWQDPKNKVIDLGVKTVRRLEIKRIEKDPESNTTYDVLEIREFEKQLNQVKKAKLKNSLHFYGSPATKIPAFKLQNKDFKPSFNPMRVNNDIMGLIDAGVIQHLLETRAISRKTTDQGTSWAVGPNLNAYLTFQNKLKALNDLVEKRLYAQKQDQNSMNALF